jgi:hypothetical protein
MFKFGILREILVGISSITGKLIGISSNATIKLGILIGPKSIKLGMSNNGSNIIIDGILTPLPLMPIPPVDIPKSGISICGNNIGGRVISGSNCNNCGILIFGNTKFGNVGITKD